MEKMEMMEKMERLEQRKTVSRQREKRPHMKTRNRRTGPNRPSCNCLPGPRVS